MSDNIDSQRNSRQPLISHKLLQIEIETITDVSQTAFDAFDVDFVEILRLAEESMHDTDLDRNDNLGIKVSQRTALVYPLFVAAVRCRNGAIRRQALNLFEELSGTESVTAVRVMSAIARRLVELEEGDLIWSRTADRPPPFSRIRDFRFDVDQVHQVVEVTYWRGTRTRPHYSHSGVTQIAWQ